MTKHRSPVMTDMLVVGLVLGMSALMAPLLHRRAVQISALEAERDGLRAQLADARREQSRLTGERDALLTDPVFIEKEARESLGLRREGEVMLAPAAPKPRMVEVEVPSPPTMVNRAVLWRYFPAAFPAAATALFALVLIVGRWLVTDDEPADQGAGDDEPAVEADEPAAEADEPAPEPVPEPAGSGDEAQDDDDALRLEDLYEDSEPEVLSRAGAEARAEADSGEDDDAAAGGVEGGCLLPDPLEEPDDEDEAL